MSINNTKLKKKVTTTTIVEEKYYLSKEIVYIRTITNGEITSNILSYTGKNVNGYGLTPVWKADLSLLKKWNPYWGENKEFESIGYGWFIATPLPEPDEILLEDIILAQSASHSFFDLNKEPIPVVLMGEYSEGRLNNANYRLKELKEYFDKHPNISFCSEILEVPYYNAGGDCGTKYIHVFVYPEVAWLKDLYANKKTRRDIFTETWNDTHPDYLGMRQFMKPKRKDEDED